MHTRRAAHRVVVAATGLALLAVTLVAGHAAPASSATSPPQFTVWGAIDGLYPGAVGVLDAHVLNPWDVTIEVTSIVVVAGDAAPGCPGSLLHFAALTSFVPVDARSQAVVAVRVTLDASAGDACRAATWPLELSATAIGPDGGGLTGADPNVSPPLSGVIANTGAESAPAVALGAALVLVGLLLTRARRSRSRRLASPIRQRMCRSVVR